MAAMDSGAVVTDASLRIADLNAAFEHLYGVDRTMLIGQDLREFLRTTEETCEGGKRIGPLLEQTGNPAELRIPQRRGDGSRFQAHIVLYPRRSLQGGWIVIVREDMTQQILDIAHTEFLRLISHELRTPLTAIKGAVSMMEESLDREAMEENLPSLKLIERNSDRLLELISELIYISKLESDMLRYRFREINLGKLVREVASQVCEDYAHKQIALLVGGNGNRLRVSADPLRMEQVCRSLLDNAFKFTPEGGRVQVDLQGSPRLVQVSISDTGVGIESDQMDRIFDRFYQADSSVTRRWGGIGLGLYVARRIISAHGGSISVESHIGEGTRVWFSLPGIAEC